MDSNDLPGTFRRIIYTSAAVDSDHLAILRESRTNNGIDGITGLLTFDGGRFVQVIEGPPDSIGAAFERILHDPRHTDIAVVSDTMERERAFGGWSMASFGSELDGVLKDRLAWLLKDAPSAVRQVFGGIGA